MGIKMLENLQILSLVYKLYVCKISWCRNVMLDTRHSFLLGCSLKPLTTPRKLEVSARKLSLATVRAHPPTDPVGQQIDLLAIRPACTTCKVHARGVCAREVHACAVPAREVHACEVHAREVHAWEVHACEVHACEVHAR